ncbi:hypothetical protein GCK32_018424, partial [Trichostrongylus colubriformis]
MIASSDDGNGGNNVASELLAHSSYNGKWNDYPCDLKLAFVCKKKVAAPIARSKESSKQLKTVISSKTGDIQKAES